MHKNIYFPIRLVCGIIFCLFSLIYFGLYQAEVMAAVQRIASEGRTHYYPVLGALIITFVLQLLQWMLYRITNLYKRFHFITNVPSFVVLFYLVSILEGNNSYWIWLAPLILIIWIITVMFCRNLQVLEDKDKSSWFSSHTMLFNLVAMLLLMFATATITGVTEDQYEKCHTEWVLTQNVYSFTAQRDTIIHTNQKDIDNHLMQLLMEKRLHDFVRTLPRYYDVTQPIPRSYAEALVLNMSLTKHPQVYWEGRYEGQSLNAEYKNFVHSSDILKEIKAKKAPSEYYPLYETFRNKYRDTYWFYYFNS